MSFWVGLAIAAILLLLGLIGLFGGGFVVFQQVRKKNAVQAARAKRASESPAPSASSQETLPPQKVPSSKPKASRAQQVSIHERPTDVRKLVDLPPPISPASSASPTLLPDVDEFDDDVPTGVFKPSEMGDIDAMMKQADKYVSTHKKGQ